MHATHTIPRVFGPDEIHSGAFASWLDSWRAEADVAWTRLAYHLRHSWARNEVLAKGEDLGEEIAQLAAQALSLLREINRWKTPPAVAA